MSDETEKDVTNDEDGVESVLNDDYCEMELMDKRVIMDCACGNKSFILLVQPIISNGGAQLMNLWCVRCKRLYPVSERGTVGEKVPVMKDGLGRSHHRLIAETGYFGKAKPPVN